MGNSARPVIELALRDLGVETRTGVSIASIDRSGVKLESGTVIPAATVVWRAGMQAKPSYPTVLS
jgi:NADH dehydrogenase